MLIHELIRGSLDQYSPLHPDPKYLIRHGFDYFYQSSFAPARLISVSCRKVLPPELEIIAFDLCSK
jgi:hypothetical protein